MKQDRSHEDNFGKNIVAVEVDIKGISPNPKQPRKNFNDEALLELKASIEKEGVLQPILLRNVFSMDGSSQYQIIAGERRWRAATQLGLETIPAIILECDDQTALQLGLIENLQRESLSPLEEASSIRALIEDFNKTQEEVATMLSKSRSYVANTLRLLRLPESVQEMLNSQKITAGHARAILDAENPEEMAKRIIEKNLSVRDAEKMMKSARGNRDDGRNLSANEPDIFLLEQAFSSKLQTKVKIQIRNRGGIVQIYFDSYDKLDELINKVA
jgi:ParB family chromosome partitioning protein